MYIGSRQPNEMNKILIKKRAHGLGIRRVFNKNMSLQIHNDTSTHSVQIKGFSRSLDGNLALFERTNFYLLSACLIYNLLDCIIASIQLY